MKKEILIITAVILSLFFYLFGYQKDRTHYELPEISQMKIANIENVLISTAKNEIKFFKKANLWYSKPDNYVLDRQKIDAMIEPLCALKLTELVSERDNYPRYDLGVERGVHVEIVDSNKDSTGLTLGKSAFSNNHTFVKIDGDANVYIAAGNLRPVFENIQIEDLRDKTVLSFDGRTINSLKILKDNKILDLTKQEVTQNKKPSGSAKKSDEISAWKDSSGKEINSTSVNEIITMLSDLKCKKFLYPSKEKAQTEKQMEISLMGDKDYRLTIFRNNDGENDIYRVKSSMTDSFFTLEENLLNRLKENIEIMIPSTSKS